MFLRPSGLKQTPPSRTSKFKTPNAEEAAFEALPNPPSTCDTKTVMVVGVTGLFQRVTLFSATKDIVGPKQLREVASDVLAGLKILI